MSYEKVLEKTKKIETLLGEKGANGKGLHEKASSIEHLLDEKTIKSIRFIASIRNKLLHEDNFILDSNLLLNFEKACENVINDLQINLSSKQQKQDYCNRTNENLKNKPYTSRFSYNQNESNDDSSNSIPPLRNKRQKIAKKEEEHSTLMEIAKGGLILLGMSILSLLE